jgi:small subunit ribosomal protein S16
MLKIRLQRVGRKHEPAFRLVLTDSKNSTKSGRFKEILGSYDPRKSTDALKPERIKHWLSVGAQPTDTVHNLLVSHKVIDGKKVNVLPKKSAPVKEAPVEEAPAAASAEASEPTETPEVAESPAEETPSAPEEAPAPETPAPAEEAAPDNA